jgi:hypothetical protein
MEPCCGHGEDVLYQATGPYECGKSMFTPFRQFNIPSRDFGDTAHGGNDTLGCAAAVEDARVEMERGPAHYCNNNGTYLASLQASKHRATRAAYLLTVAPLPSMKMSFLWCFFMMMVVSFRTLLLHDFYFRL